MTSLQRSNSVIQIADRRGTRCSVASHAVHALYYRLERHAAAIFEHAQWQRRGLAFAQRASCGDAVATLWGFLERRGCVVGSPGARCKDAVYFDNIVFLKL